MKLINANAISYSNGSRTILRDASFCVQKSKKYALIGPNGTGKTTLLRLITGELEVESGTITSKESLKWSLVPQEAEPGDGRTIREYMLSPLAPAIEKMGMLEKQMQTARDEELADLLVEYQKVQDLFETAGGYGAEDKALNLLASLGVQNDPDQIVDTLSGGEQSLLFFARALAGDPELLILDEPGNHLDYLGLAWLESFLQNFSGAVIIVSHNRYMINRICDEIWHLQNGSLTVFNGNYNRFKTGYLRDGAIKQNEYQKAQKEIGELNTRISRLQSIARSQYNPPPGVLSELKSLMAKKQRVEQNMPDKQDILADTVKISVTAQAVQADIACEVKNLRLSAGDTFLADNVSIALHCGERAAIVGLNGTGKTTLLEKIVKEGSWDSDLIRIGPSQRLGYLSQKPQFAADALTIADEVKSWGQLSRDEVYDTIKKFLFTYTDLDKKLSVLSGGEKNRLQLARLIYHKANFLVLDEPTNHMDIQTREVMEEVLTGFAGTILFVSHDRYFLDTVAQRVIEIADRKINVHQGNFTDFFKKRYRTLPRLSGSITTRAKERSAYNDTSSKNASGQKEKQLEKRIEEMEQEIVCLTRELEVCVSEKNSAKSRQLASRLDKLDNALIRLYAEWDSICKI
ncbi:MAG: ABC-F family ATP-binding cassette domain-containing protein [Spirochaetes bacterium]|nr:ABC-F family ATP-binding cassette domain-containing protein [Spirochaetota bacterium]MBN2770128.1 ABC-F family ATP-binding cassette domain-containing protein [Spirochaetota bacterium]